MFVHKVYNKIWKIIFFLLSFLCITMLGLNFFALFGLNDLIAIPRFACAGKQSFSKQAKRERERESQEKGATMCHNKLQPSKVTKEWRNIPLFGKPFPLIFKPFLEKRYLSEKVLSRSQENGKYTPVSSCFISTPKKPVLQMLTSETLTSSGNIAH